MLCKTIFRGRRFLRSGWFGQSGELPSIIVNRVSCIGGKMAERLEVQIGKPEDLDDILKFLGADWAGNIRKKGGDELQDMLRHEVVYVVRSLDKGGVIATSYLIKSPNELGGALVHPDYRRCGIAYYVGLAAIVNFLFSEYDSCSIGATVVSSNTGPRKTLERLGFAFEAQEAVDASKISGVEHIPRGEDGMINVDLFVWRESEALRLIQDALTWVQDRSLPLQGDRHLSVGLRFFDVTLLEELLEIWRSKA